jgi:hypothetical protein
MWKCALCGVEHGDLPTCFGFEAPWRSYVREEEFESRVLLTPDQLIIDDEDFFIRGHIEIPIQGMTVPFAYSVWTSLSRKSHDRIGERWEAPDRASDPPYFGWLCTWLPNYPKTTSLKIMVQSREPGVVPLFTLEPTEHPLAVEQRNGISQARWHELALKLMGESES